MPRRYKKKSYRRKKKSSYLKTSGTGLTKSFPLSKKFTFKTRYVEIGTFNPSLGIPQTKVFNMSSLYDPDTTGIGHQPIGFDQIMPMYDHFVVIGARARIQFANQAENSQLCLINIKDNQTVSTNIQETIENGLSRYLLINAKGGDDLKTLSMNYSAKKFFGKSPMDGDKYQGSINNNPTENAYLHVTVDPSGAGTDNQLKYMITIEYIAILSEPKQLGQS